ncbi:MAG TPA: DUF2341 domain-containing protein, partial [Bryobacteraceae bacterium]|nr:DUF2341 domain-containing protein [Bryobacteraceae bacterium]
MNRQLSVLLGLCLIADCLLGQQQILNNGDFEKGMMCYSTAVWSTTGQPFQGDYSFLLSTDSHSGSNSLEIRCTGADCFKAAIISDRIQTPPSQAYKLKLHTKCPAGRSAAVYIPDTLGGDTFQYVTCNDAWSPNEIAFTSGAAATDLLLFVYNRDVEWLRIDDMVLTYADGTVPQQPVLHPGSRNVTTSGQTLLVDGAPYFARGFFDVSYQDLPKVAALGANTLNGLQMNMSASCFNTARMDYLDRAYELGLNFMPDSSSTARLKTPGIFPNVVNRFGPHLANIGWFLADEPDQAGIAPWYIPGAMLVSEYQAIKSASLLPVMADFQRPTWSSIDETRPYVGSTDIWMAEPYGSEFFRIDNAVNIFNQLRTQPIWIAEDTDAALILPKAYWAVIKGVSGIVYYNWPGFKDDAPRLNAVSQVFTELKQLNDVIFAPSAPVTPPAGIGAVGRLWNGVTHVLAANAAATTVQGTFAVPSLAAGTPVTVLFENRVITAQAGGFTDTFSGASRHVYSFRMGSPTTPVTLASTPSGLTLTVDNASCVTPCNYNWAPGSSHTIAAPATAPGTSGTRSSFSAWSDSGALSHSITVPSTALTLTASYLTQYYLTTSANPVGGGGITPAGGWFNSGAAVSVAAAPGNGYQFFGFSGALSGAVSPQTLTLAGPAAVTANYTAVSQSGWYDVFANRRKITIDHTRISGALANFPLLVSLANPELKSISNGGKVSDPGGNDIVFTAADGTTRLNHELESYNPSSGSIAAWVQVPSVNPSTDIPIYIYYGKAGAAAQQKPASVWDSGYRVVNHFKDTGASDSTQYLNSAVANAGATLTPAGVVGSAYSVDGVAGQLSIPYSASWNGAFSSYTVELWIKPGGLRDYAGAVSAGGWGSPFNIWFYRDGFATLELDTTSGYCATSGSIPL